MGCYEEHDSHHVKSRENDLIHTWYWMFDIAESNDKFIEIQNPTQFERLCLTSTSKTIIAKQRHIGRWWGHSGCCGCSRRAFGSCKYQWVIVITTWKEECIPVDTTTGNVNGSASQSRASNVIVDGYSQETKEVRVCYLCGGGRTVAAYRRAWSVALGLDTRERTSNQDKDTEGLGLLIGSGDRKNDEGGKSDKDFGEHCW